MRRCCRDGTGSLVAISAQKHPQVLRVAVRDARVSCEGLLVKTASCLCLECAVEKGLQTCGRRLMPGRQLFLRRNRSWRPAVQQADRQQIPHQSAVSLGLVLLLQAGLGRQPDLTRQHQVKGRLRCQISEVCRPVAVLRMLGVELHKLASASPFDRRRTGAMAELHVAKAADQPGAQAVATLRVKFLQQPVPHHFHEEILHPVLRIVLLQPQ